MLFEYPFAYGAVVKLGRSDKRKPVTFLEVLQVGIDEIGGSAAPVAMVSKGTEYRYRDGVFLKPRVDQRPLTPAIPVRGVLHLTSIQADLVACQIVHSDNAHRKLALDWHSLSRDAPSRSPDVADVTEWYSSGRETARQRTLDVIGRSVVIDGNLWVPVPEPKWMVMTTGGQAFSRIWDLQTSYEHRNRSQWGDPLTSATFNVNDGDGFAALAMERFGHMPELFSTRVTMPEVFAFDRAAAGLEWAAAAVADRVADVIGTLDADLVSVWMDLRRALGAEIGAARTAALATFAETLLPLVADRNAREQAEAAFRVFKEHELDFAVTAAPDMRRA